MWLDKKWGLANVTRLRLNICMLQNKHTVQVEAHISVNIVSSISLKTKLYIQREIPPAHNSFSLKKNNISYSSSAPMCNEFSYF